MANTPIVLECVRPFVPEAIEESIIKLHDPAGLTNLWLVMTKGEEPNTVHLELTNGSGIPLSTGVADRFQIYTLLISKRDVLVGVPSLGLRFDARTGRIWLESAEFRSASLLFMRRWELQEALGSLFGA